MINLFNKLLKFFRSKYHLTQVTDQFQYPKNPKQGQWLVLEDCGEGGDEEWIGQIVKTNGYDITMKRYEVTDWHIHNYPRFGTQLRYATRKEVQRIKALL